MNGSVRDNADARQELVGAIRRRHVIYVSGYDPRGAQGYFDLLQRTCERFRRLWPIAATLQSAEPDTNECARWQLNLRGATWQVATRYDFLRMEHFIRADMAKPTPVQLLSALGWFAGDVLSGAQFRIFRAAWRFALHLLYFQALALAWLAAAASIGVATGGIAIRYFGMVALAGGAVGLAAGVTILFALRPLAERWRVVQIAACWSTLRRFGRARSTWIDRVVEIGARRVIDAARSNETDEVAVVGHSTGGAIASAIMARALELDPDLGRSGPRLVLLTLGSVMPAIALHPAAQAMRSIVSRLAIAPTLAWIDCQSRKDVMCFANFDPVEGLGVRVGARRCNPLLWRISFKDMIAPEAYDRFRWNHFRAHYQYILPGDRPAPYDYVLLVGGPLPMTEWLKTDRSIIAVFAGDTAAAGGDRRHDLLIADTTP